MPQGIFIKDDENLKEDEKMNIEIVVRKFFEDKVF